jgi:hypothetical protein
VDSDRLLRAIGEQLDALGPEYRLSPEKQARAEELLEKKKGGLLDQAERRGLNAILREADEIMLRRAEALDRIPGACPSRSGDAADPTELP